jgi:hypothetical protein
VFHLLVSASTRRLVAGRDRAPIRARLSRSFEHSHMKRVALTFTAAKPSDGPWTGALPGAPSPDLRRVAETFVTLQEQRHAADYDIERVFRRSEARANIQSAATAFEAWEHVRGTFEADLFLVALLARTR